MSTNKDTGRKSMVIDFGTGKDPFNAVQFHKSKVDDSIEEQDTEVDDDTSPQPIINNQGDVSQDGSTDVISDDSDEELDESGADDDIETDTNDDGDGDDDVNLYYHIGNELKGDSFLPDDFEITRDIDGLTLKESIKSQLRKELEPAIRQEYNQVLISQGYNEQDLIVARALRSGVDPRLLSTASMYETYSKIADDISTNEKETVIRSMYQTRGLQENEISNLIKVAKGDEDDEKLNENFNKLFQDSKRFFEEKYNDFIKSEEERNNQLQRQAQENLNKTNELINSVISTRKLRDVEMTPQQAKDFEEAIRKTSVVDINGQKYQATELQKFLYDFQINDELKLFAFYLHKFREQQADQMKKKAKKEVETEFMKSYKQRVIKGKASKNKGKVNEQLNAHEKKGQSIFLDFSK